MPLKNVTLKIRTDLILTSSLDREIGLDCGCLRQDSEFEDANIASPSRRARIELAAWLISLRNVTCGREVLS